MVFPFVRVRNIINDGLDFLACICYNVYNDSADGCGKRAVFGDSPIVVGAVFLWGGKNAFKFGFIGVLQIQIRTHK